MNDALAVQRGRRVSDRYTLLEKLGAGGQGEVWRARDEARGVEVALKLLNPTLAHDDSAWAALEREHAIASRLDHAGVLRVYPPQRDGDSVVLPMDLATGGDLRRLRGANYLEIVPVLIEIAQTLEYAHERGIVHRDLKPGNVLFAESGRPRIADFGAAGAVPALGATAEVLAARPALSPFTASPGQLRGEPPAAADDIYGLGALAYELFSGYPPYYPRFDLKRVLEEPVPELKSKQTLPPQLQALAMRMLAKDPAARPRSMREVIDVLDTALNDTLTFEFDKPAASKDTPSLPSPARGGGEEGAASLVPSPVEQRERVREGASVPRPAPAPLPPPASPWDDLKIEVAPQLLRLEPERARRGPWIALVLLAAAAFGAFYWLPRYAPADLLAKVQPVAPSPVAIPNGTPAPDLAAAAAANAKLETQLAQTRAQFKQQLASLEARAAGVWGGADFAAAKSRAAESVGAYDGGNARLAQERLEDAQRLLSKVEKKAPQALSAQLSAADRALAAGQPEVARQAYGMARRIDPRSAAALDGLRRVSSLGGVLPLLADAQNAEAARDFGRAAQDYSQALSLDPANAAARAGLSRAHAGFGEDSYAKAVGSGFAALGAGRLDEARTAFENARSIRPAGAEAANGLSRVGAALSARGFASVRQRGADLEAQERWDDALKQYEAALKLDPSLAFAQAGKARSAERATLATSLQSLIDEPDRLAAPSVRAEAGTLIQRAQAQPNIGPVLRSQVQRLQILLPQFDIPIRLALVSDNATSVEIPRVGAFGTFARREVQLKPGKYTVVGTRAGFRDVRREITVAPGNNEVQTISVSCSEPI